ncbi:helix-turn-helix transcriptional regulator [Streptomyces sp. IBSBF 2435]|uniref:helix-turn-helix transcriptional regulator n=1 Tax=Streptomyces sp. IBSBF 2435 TaxID=2903531 RepID=UPI002FDBC23F
MDARRELARRRKTLGYSQERLAEVLGVDRVTIGRWERGETEPQPYLRPRLAKALKSSAAEIEALLSPEDDRPAPVPARAVSAEALGAHAEAGYLDDMIRREFLRLVSLTGALVALSPGDADRASIEDAAEVQVMTSHLWQVYSLARAKQTVYPLVRDQISDLTRLLGHAHREGRHRELCGQAGNLFQLAGEIFFDGNRYTEAAECYALAASASKEAGNADLWAASLTRHSFIGVYERRFRETAPMLDAAGLLARKGDSHLSTRYWVAAVQAQVYAGLGDLDACNRALDQAQEVHRLNDPSPGGWLRFDGSRLDEERGSCYVTLGRLDLAEAALINALGRQLSMRRQGSVLTDLAVIGARRRDIDRLLSYGTAAVELAERTSSGYIGRKLEGLRGHLAPFLPDKRVTDFNDRISSLIAA